MIKAVVLDIDGVIVGNQKGINFPHPSKRVTAALRTIHNNGIPVSFLTAKPTFSAIENIKTVGIDNPHIADGGATIFNPIHDQIIHTIKINPNDILHLLRSLPKQTYVNLFSTKEYYLEKPLKNEFTQKYGTFIGSFPKLVDNLEAIVQSEDIPKINIYALHENEKEVIDKVVKDLSGGYSYNWSTNPHIAPIQVMVVTAKGVSKRSGVEFLGKNLTISVKDILGVGDTIHDWDFIEICGYKGIMGNATAELKEKITADDPQQMIGGHVNEDGVLNIFRHFKLLK